MWTIDKVKTERPKYSDHNNLRYISEDEEKVMLLQVKDMSEYSACTDEKLKEYIFNLNLSDSTTARMLDYVNVPSDTLVQSIIRSILSLVWFTYCFPVFVSLFILSVITESEISYRRSGLIPVKFLLLQVLFACIFSTSIYYLLIKVL